MLLTRLIIMHGSPLNTVRRRVEVNYDLSVLIRFRGHDCQLYRIQRSSRVTSRRIRKKVSCVGHKNGVQSAESSDPV